jgi:hypothetical protein
MLSGAGVGTAARGAVALGEKGLGAVTGKPKTWWGTPDRDAIRNRIANDPEAVAKGIEHYRPPLGNRLAPDDRAGLNEITSKLNPQLRAVYLDAMRKGKAPAEAWDEIRRTAPTAASRLETTGDVRASLNRESMLPAEYHFNPQTAEMPGGITAQNYQRQLIDPQVEASASAGTSRLGTLGRWGGPAALGLLAAFGDGAPQLSPADHGSLAHWLQTDPAATRAYMAQQWGPGYNQYAR